MPTKTSVDEENCDASPSVTLQELPQDIAPGAAVLVRKRRCRLEAYLAHSDCGELHLSPEGEVSRRILLWPFDRPVSAVAPTGVLRPCRLRTWARRLGVVMAGASIPCALGARSVSARILSYQLAPAIAVAAGTSNLLLADEVGLGKTVQAGWILADLFARHAGARALVAVPAGLRLQWRSELASLFGLDAIVADARWLRLSTRDLPGDVNAWSLPGLYLASVDFLKQPDIARSLKHLLWDALIVDEAHTAAAPTDRHLALEQIGRRARVVATLTATPFSGDGAAFESIARLGASRSTAALMFRRSREDVGSPRRRRHRFALVRVTADEWRLHRLLDRYTRLVWREAAFDVDAARLAMTVLRKRALSSPFAAARSLQRRRSLLDHRIPLPQQLTFFDDEEAADEEPVAALGAAGLADAEHERRWVSLLVEAAARAISRDSKLRFLQRLLNRRRDNAAIVFTEYRDTLVRLGQAFPHALLLHGGMAPDERREAQRRFSRDGGVLLATDAASEGLNLQERCRLVINYELPWNPARLEQRIGRVDRIGQHRLVHAITLVARDTAEDLVVANLTRRLSRVAATMGERDRLAGFLDEARTARLVMDEGTASVEAASSTPLTVVGHDVAAYEALAMFEARRLEALRATAPVDTGDPGGIFISSLRQDQSLPEGSIFVCRWTARTAHEVIVEARVFALQVRCAIGAPPRSAEAIRARARAVLEAHSRDVLEAARAMAVPRLDEARHAHGEAVDHWIAREQELRAWADGHTAVQPGLFDRRALDHLAADSAAADDIDRDHERRIAWLERTRPLHDAIEVIGVLLVCRRSAA